jgi:hypothetical protein
VTYGFWLQVVEAHFGQVCNGVKPIFHGGNAGRAAAILRENRSKKPGNRTSA